MTDSREPLRSGVVLQDGYAPGEIGALAEEIEELGYTHLWLTDSSLHTHDVFSSLTIAALRTTRLILGCAVTNPLTRHPAITANAIATVAGLAPGRVIYGIGAGDRPLAALALQPAKLAAVQETISVSRTLLNGERFTGAIGDAAFDDAYLYHPADPPPPIWLAASGPKTLELAGAKADGAIVLAGLFPAGINFALDRIERGLRDAPSARRQAFDPCVFMYGSIDNDVSQAIAAARPIAAWFPQTARHYCELAGMDAELIETIKARYRGGEFQEAGDAAALISDELVQTLALAGDRHTAAAKVEMLIAQGIRNVAIFPLGDRRMETVRTFARDVLPAFSSKTN